MRSKRTSIWIVYVFYHRDIASCISFALVTLVSSSTKFLIRLKAKIREVSKKETRGRKRKKEGDKTEITFDSWLVCTRSIVSGMYTDRISNPTPDARRPTPMRSSRRRRRLRVLPSCAPRCLRCSRSQISENSRVWAARYGDLVGFTNFCFPKFENKGERKRKIPFLSVSGKNNNKFEIFKK